MPFRPWSSWPASDPRSGWAVVVLRRELTAAAVWQCPGVRGSPLASAIQTMQSSGTETNAWTTTYWMWRFDRMDDPVPLDNFWGKTEMQIVRDLQEANNPFIGVPGGASEVEMVVDPYFPITIPSLPDQIRGRAAHPGGRNRSFLDGHVEFLKDPRTR